MAAFRRHDARLSPSRRTAALGQAGAGGGLATHRGRAGLQTAPTNTEVGATPALESVEWQQKLLTVITEYIFTEIAHVGVRIGWDQSVNGLALRLGGGGLFSALMMELVFAMTGTAGFVNCADCGTPFAPRRQPTPGVRYYCVACGRREANRQAQARFRANHKGYFSRQKRKPDLKVVGDQSA